VAAIRVGVIAEDQSDVDVVGELVSKVTKRQVSIRSFVGHGAGRIVYKCAGWAQVLRQQGCTRLILVRDLDTDQLAEVRARLQQALGNCQIARRIVVIPVREIEAWLLADEVAIGRFTRAPKAPKPIGNPEARARAKEDLRDLIYRLSERRIAYVNAIHNRQLAKLSALVKLRRCASFVPLEDFIRANLR
jgi:hypothetical protein